MIVEIRVSTNLPHQGVQEKDGMLRVRVKAKPLEGKANKEVIELVAKHFRIPEQNVSIIRGFSSNKKIVEITQPFFRKR
jgi:hypothetical protein